MKKTFASLICFVFFVTGCAQEDAQPTSAVDEENDILSLSTTPSHEIVVGEEISTDSVLHPLMLGVIAGPDPSAPHPDAPDLTEQYQDIGIVSVRNNGYQDDRLSIEGIFNCGGDTYPSWEGCDANDDSFYNWEESDAQYQSYIDGGFVPFLRIGGEWENMGDLHDFKGPQNAIQESNWIIAANKMVDRYENWSEEPNAFTYVDIWTEFPGTHFWDRSNGAFILFWIEAYKAIKAEHPNLKVGGPGFNAAVTVGVADGDGGAAESLLENMYNEGITLDWMGWHTFTSDPTLYAKAAQGYQDLLDGTGAFSDVSWAGTGFFKDTEVFTDAYGNGTGEAGMSESQHFSVGTAPGTALLTAGWISLQYADIQGAFYFRGNDYGDEQSANSGVGLFTTYGDYKPGSNAFRLWSVLTNSSDAILETNIPTDGSKEGLWALATQRSSGGINFLIANTGDMATSFSITVDDKDILSFGTASAYIVDDTNDGLTEIPLTENTISLPKGAVELIVLEP
ncbi:MAG: hypothetical protein WCT46_05250 [Candidatus Gracilibacteria bacterium]